MSTDFSNANRQPMQQLHSTQAEWDNAPKPALAVGQLAATTDTGRLYLGTDSGDVAVGATPEPALLRQDTFRIRFDRVRSGMFLRVVVEGANGVLLSTGSGGLPEFHDAPGGVFELQPLGGLPIEYLITPATENPSNPLEVSKTGQITQIVSFDEGFSFEHGEIQLLDVRSCTNLRRLSPHNAAVLSELLLPPSNTLALDFVDPNYGAYHYSSNSFESCGLSASDLNRLFESLAVVSSGNLFVQGNPGSATCDPSIATAKGYAVVGV